MYCAKNYGRGFIRVYEDKMPVIILCTVHNYAIIRIGSIKTGTEHSQNLKT